MDSKFEEYRATLKPWQQEIFSEEFVAVLVRDCEQKDIDPWLVISIIEGESGFDNLALDEEKDHFGLMQLSAIYHFDRLRRLGGVDFYNPIDNLRTGIDLLGELKRTVLVTNWDMVEMSDDEDGDALFLFMSYYLGNVAVSLFRNNDIPAYAREVVERFKELRDSDSISN